MRTLLRTRPPRLNQRSLQADNLLFAAPLSSDYGGLFHELVSGNHVTLGTDPPAVQADVEQGLVPVFDGTNDYLVTGANVDLSSAGTGPITLAFWMYWDAFSTDDDLCLEHSANINSNPGSFLVLPNSSSPNAFAMTHKGAASNFRIASFARPSAAVWHHYVLQLHTDSAANHKAWVDAVSQSMTTGENTGGTAWGSFPLYCMARGGATLFGAGRLRDVRIYNGTLPGAMIWQLWDPGTRWDLYRPSGIAMVAVPSAAGATIDAALTASASVAASLSTEIRCAATVSASLAATGALSTTLACAAAVSASGMVAADLSTQITPAAAVSCAVTVGGDLTVSTSLQAAVALSATVAAAIQTQITLAASISLPVSAASAITTAITLAGSLPAAATLSGSLLTVISLGGALSLRATVSADLASAIGLASSLTLEVLATGALQTEIRMAATVALTLTSSSALTVLQNPITTMLDVTISVAAQLAETVEVAQAMTHDVCI